jgi:hypothetical protein
MTERKAPATPGRVPECPLNLGGFDAAYRIAGIEADLSERSELLTVALREHFSEREAKNKAKKALARVWLNPPPDAQRMISWALENPQVFPDHRLMHAGALMATFPFVGGILATIGRHAALGETISVPDLRRRVEGQWGATSTVREGVGKAVTTLRRLDIVRGGGRTPVTRAELLACGPLAATWLIHAVMLTRQANAIDMYEAKVAPELFWVDSLTPSNEYPLFEIHIEGPKRRVWVIR